MASDNPQLPVCFLCLETIRPKQKATAIDFDLLPQKFLVFTENHLNIPSEEWTLGLLDGVKLENAFCLECRSFISIICSLYENLCDIQAKLADKMGQLSNLLECSRERVTRRKRQDLMETLERQLGVNGSDGKKVEKMRDMLGDKCKLYSKNSQTSISSERYNDVDNSEAWDNDSVDVKIENSSINGSDDDDNLQNDSMDSFNGDPHKMDEQDQESSASVSSPSSSDDNDSLDEDEDDPDISLEKETSSKKSPAEKGPFRCDLCEKEFSFKSSIHTHMKNVHGTYPQKPEKPFSCKLCPNKYGTRNSLISHISFKHRGHSILNKCFKCDICGQGATTKLGVVLHKKKMHGIGPSTKNTPTYAPKKFPCNFCPKSFADRTCLGRHLKAKHKSSSSDVLFPCKKCSLKFDTLQQRVTHTKSVHKKETDLVTGAMETNTSDHTKKSCVDGEDNGNLQNSSNKMDEQDQDQSDSDSSTGSDKDDHEDDDSFVEPSTKTEPTSAKKFPCNFCPKSFRDSNSWSRHLTAKHKSHNKDEAQAQMTSSSLPYSCTECPMSFDTQRQKVHHIYTVHKKDKQTGGFMKRLEGAMKTDTSDQTQQSCVVCSEQFKSWKLLHYHLKQKHEKLAANKKSLMCYFCNCLFCHQQSVWAHLKTCITHNYTKIEFPCDHVDHLGYSQWVFKDPTELEYHFKEEHGNCEVLKCVDCGFPFLDKNMLELHRLVHLPRIKSKYHCPGCSNTFLNTDTLQHHYNSFHGVSLKLYRCLNCNMGFAAKSAIQLHSPWCLGGGNEDKQQALEFLCSECPKSYATAYQLKTHVRGIHITVQCPYCEVMLPRSKIGHHKMMKHAKEEFLCTLCGKAYKTRTLLQTHMSAHGQYRFVCKYCGSGSRSSYHLKRHIGRMHKDKLAEEAAAKNINN